MAIFLWTGLGAAAGSPLGLGSAVNGMLHTAAFALEHGFGFQHSVQTCPQESRFHAPFCFFGYGHGDA